MKKSISLLAALLVITACTNQAAYTKNQINSPKKKFNTSNVSKNDDAYIKSVQDFALDFYDVLDVKENQVFSPLSIATCFSMLYDGTDGGTREELRNVLHYEQGDSHLEQIKNMLLKCAIDDSNNKTYLNISQSIWFRGDGSSFKDDYLEKLTNYYYAEVFKGVNFMSNEDKQMMADWVNNKTKKFLNVTPDSFPATPNTVMYLMNAIYAKSQWSIENLFKKSNNSEKVFHNIDDSSSTKTFMNGKAEGSSYYEYDTYRVASLPYKHNMQINILLPNEGTNYSEVLKDKEALSNMINFGKQSDLERASIQWILPKFKIICDYDLQDVMTNLGLDETFDKEKVNLSRMSDEPGLYIESAEHKAGIEINNEGVEAAAFTFVAAGAKSAAPNASVTFKVDHPFAYYLTTNEGLPLFMGVINSL